MLSIVQHQPVVDGVGSENVEPIRFAQRLIKAFQQILQVREGHASCLCDRLHASEYVVEYVSASLGSKRKETRIL